MIINKSNYFQEKIASLRDLAALRLLVLIAAKFFVSYEVPRSQGCI